MKMRWAVAAVSCLALALLTLNADPWSEWTQHVDAAALQPKGASCPANAKPAALKYTLKDINNQNVNLASFKGKVILMDFWATWCGPCKVEIPWFIEFQKKYGPQGLQVVGVSIDDTLEKLKPFVSNMKMNYVVLQGLNHDDFHDEYGPMFGVPVTVLISRDGKTCFKHVGLSSKPDFEAQIKSLL